MESLIGGCFGCLLILGVICIGPYVFMLLWNWLMPMIFGLTTITFWQSFGIVIFLTIIGNFFKSSNEKR